MTHLTLFLFFIFFSFHILTLNAAKCHEDDESGLLSFKSGITHDPSGMLTSWKPGSECCSWPGITCLSGTRVTAISLNGQPDNPNNSLSGTISPSLSKIRFLDGIYFSDLKNLSGPFPGFLFNLPNILFVYINNNKLSGPLPANIGNIKTLNALSISNNRFTGKIPTSISQLTQLTQLNLNGNFFNGNIPTGISRLTNLTVMSLQHNQLSGKVPDFFSGFSNLRIINLSHNKFSGEIPGSISKLATKLAYLELGHNFLTGKIPDFLGKFHQLDTLDLSRNNLSGVVPKSFENLTKIFNLDLSHNYLIDPFPNMKVKGIESIDLSYNSFHLGKIPNWVTSSPIIYSLKLAKCGIKMKLDDFNPTETYFYDYIDLSDNEITGSPVKLLNRTDLLVGFSASGNKLKFNLGDLRFVKTLKELDLSRNLVFGKVPNAVTGLDKLNLSYNHLCGALPMTKFPASVFVGNDCLCGSPLSSCKL